MKFHTIGALLLGLSLLAPAWAGQGGKRFEKMAEYLGLSQEQRTQIQPYRENMKASVQAERDAFQATLSADQKAQLEQMKAERKERWAKRQSNQEGERTGRRGQRRQRLNLNETLNLTAEQSQALERMKTNIKAEKEAFHSTLTLLLTPEQQQKLEEKKQRKRERRQRRQQQ